MHGVPPRRTPWWYKARTVRAGQPALPLHVSGLVEPGQPGPTDQPSMEASQAGTTRPAPSIPLGSAWGHGGTTRHVLIQPPMAALSGSGHEWPARPNTSIRCTFGKGAQIHVGTRIEAADSPAT